MVNVHITQGFSLFVKITFTLWVTLKVNYIISYVYYESNTEQLFLPTVQD